ncbi:MAG: protein-L-isoaspartate O-methyltransferase [Candidatus Buchananbacteria bacterium RIFCSPHIGHO2_01_FULL_39_14]|uniref:Protein-L-isoaspartate O-methyltransferase n=2 Tax=Candidatus Buchananiibacteriota TaxID=1817903 RepID=A0A1G1YPL2_9BACT|nr:MAG: protein-L-isoaspartate O-methyltransferase [Candidatus Buchananbacteria bacterium RIFCSPHIGHO2_01_FULL_39_14]OGY49674.1 MAG: protein-L-isoaspartate O-methyltransferase [Candidatus Buchananbacteria bacterium RIFCSPHIGHO2_02_FULL_39_17]OGY54305.1 MAG: protein-L-isoaspartate O-methyltransferase [Candidatus Buchananbacteria bacterium RIFCSPLOWO2_01_FULL_40_23b]
MDELIQQLISDGYLKTPAIIDAFYKIKRRDFLPPDLASEEAINAPLPIGHGQTISQPLTVAFMLELLKPEVGQKILDIGSGSGWTTAILAEIVGPKGKIFGIERIAELKEFGEQNTAKYNFSNVKFFCRDGTKGLDESAPFDRILVGAAANEIPNTLKDQLKIGGRLVIPTEQQDIRLIIREGKNKFKEIIYHGFVFVPLIED